MSTIDGAGEGSTPFSSERRGPGTWRRRLREFLRTETGGAAVLLTATVAALAWMNIDASSYEIRNEPLRSVAEKKIARGLA